MTPCSLTVHELTPFNYKVNTSGLSEYNPSFFPSIPKLRMTLDAFEVYEKDIPALMNPFS